MNNNFFKKRNITPSTKSISYTNSTNKNISKYNTNKKKETKYRNKSNNISLNENKIYQNNPLELTFGSSSFISNIQSETNENGKNKNKSFIMTINNKKNKKEKKDLIRHNKIIKLKKKLIFDPKWKINQNNNKNFKNKKNEIIIHNYKTKNKYEFINNHYTNININYKEKNYHSVNISNEGKKNNKKNLFKNKILKKRNEKDKKIRNYTTKNSAIQENNTLKKIKSTNNTNKEYIIKININDKGNGRYKLIIQRTNKYIKRMPKSAPKLFLAHPSLKNLFL